MFTVKEIYYTLQGEGFHTGRQSVFCRFSGCNLWSGHEEDRADAICNFCDTDFVGVDGPGGGKFRTALELAELITASWDANAPSIADKFVVLTGGEPMLQVNDEFIEAMHDAGFTMAIETNGTIQVPSTIDWICVSPKNGTELIQVTGHELKYIYPQAGGSPENYEELEFEHFYIQPMDGPDQDRNVALSLEYCEKNPMWKMSLQTHKYLGIK